MVGELFEFDVGWCAAVNAIADAPKTAVSARA
jgi:hypothetical protein